MDVIGNFLKERCEHKQEATIRARELFKAYQDWCNENNEHASSERFFGLRLKELGQEQKRYNDGRYWVVVQIKNEK
jgi:putative DNA primase/helicase